MVSPRNIHGLPLSILKGRLKDLHSLISAPSAFLFPAPLCSLRIPCCRKCQALQSTSPTPSTHMIHSDLSRKWGPNKHLPSCCLTSPGQHMRLLNTCLWEVLLLCRFVTSALSRHGPSASQASYLTPALFTYLFVSLAYPAMSQSIPYQWSPGPGLSPSPVTLGIDYVTELLVTI